MTYDLQAEGPYARLICQFILKEYPRRTAASSGMLVDLLTDEILATKLVRYGPKPAPEALVEIRKIIGEYTADGRPIPFMVPWGSEKPEGGQIDVAELMALRQLKGLNDRIAQHYSPGAEFGIRLEDASAPHLFYYAQDEARRNAKQYVDDLEALVKVLELTPWIELRPESKFVTEKHFAQAADKLLPVVEEALHLLLTGETNNERVALELLRTVGWQGGISRETLAFYAGQYVKLYPLSTAGERKTILARYFTAALARKVLGIRGDKPEWKGRFLDLSFVPPTPGVGALFARRVYYRTIPQNFTSNHIPPWRARGYLEISNDNETTPKLAAWGEKLELEQNMVEFIGAPRTKSVKVAMPILLG